jgi:pimeloyl-ACP methyl ester carboxylesterase
MTNELKIVLVHGAWADASSWSRVIPVLSQAGYSVSAAQNPMTSLADDVEVVRRLVEAQDGPVLLVAHSYGGVVITEAAHKCPNVVGMVYVAAFAPEVGESLSILGSLGPPPPGFVALRPDKYGTLWLDKELFADNFCPDVDKQEAFVMATTQHPISGQCFEDKITNAGWKNLPCWYQISEQDRMIPPAAEKFMAERMKPKLTISLASSHASLVSHPAEISELVLKAVKEVLSLAPAQPA